MNRVVRCAEMRIGEMNEAASGAEINSIAGVAAAVKKEGMTAREYAKFNAN